MTTTLAEPAGFAELTKLDQIRYLQDLWDRISVRPENIAIPPSHLEILEQRLEAHRQDPDRARPANEVLDRLARR